MVLIHLFVSRTLLFPLLDRFPAFCVFPASTVGSSYIYPLIESLFPVLFRNYLPDPFLEINLHKL